MSRPELANILQPATEARDRCLVQARGNAWETQACNTQFLETLTKQLGPSLGDRIPQTSQEVCNRNVGSGCFAKGTLVRTPRGLFPIEQLQTGEEVITHDSRIAKIHKAHVASANELVRVTFTDKTNVVSTPWHRFFDIYGTLVKAEQLVVGTYVRNFDYSVAQVSRVEVIARGVANDVYNLSLERDVGFFANGKLVEAPHANRILDTKSLLTRAS